MGKGKVSTVESKLLDSYETTLDWKNPVYFRVHFSEQYGDAPWCLYRTTVESGQY